MQAGDPRLPRICAALVAAGLCAAPAGAAPADLAAWVAANTDLPVPRVAIAGPEHVYSVEPLGPPTTTGEVIALVRSERLGDHPAAASGPQSWEAHLLFDCGATRMRQIRSVTWPSRNRQGRPTVQPPREGWIVPEQGQPAMQLLTAACDTAYAWPLRQAAGAPAPTPAGVTPEYLPDLRPARAALPPAVLATPAPAPGPSRNAVQVARGPSSEGASRALAQARRTLGPLAEGVTGETELSHVGSKRRYTAVLAGFPTPDAAEAACARLAAAGQSCFTVKSAR